MTNTTTLSADFDENYATFIADAFATGCVWGLESPEGFALCSSNNNDEIDVMPFWSQPEYAKQHCIDDWQHYQPVAIALEELLDDWLTGMHEDVTMVGVNWNSELEGLEVEPLDLLEDFDQAASEAP